ncbi:HtaA domain-containing protein [Leucobacter massiliensis]|uniref:Htaa domain-containing protein n=1 Tax=Leucobacter massiliensis TaxID=1686285 RepID=A0A2S9QKZ7_9MICO|nr:HtaA domain-containing protein [Leucobacter massiliensis]PRI10266.1 hypothetical protein B4915_12790 [Leucobacter massiliensis]
MTRSLRRAAVILGGSALAGSLLIVPGLAPGTPASAAEEACTVSGGTLVWGVKESFRSYISGSIANGSWETSDGAEYETPAFSFTGASGEIDPETGTGSVSFAGTVHFTGHEGVLDLTLANPTVEFEGDGTAALLLDARSTDVEGEVTVDAEQEWVGEVTVADPLAPQGGALRLSDLPTSLTNSGAKAFAGFYEAGAELDPLTLSLEFDACDAAGAAAPAPADEAGDGAAAPAATEPVSGAEDPSGGLPWLPIGIGAAALLVIGVTVGMLLGGRKRSPLPQQADAPQQGTAPQQAETPAAPGTQPPAAD